MCTMIAQQVKILVAARAARVGSTCVKPTCPTTTRTICRSSTALNIDFVNEAMGPGARVAVELSVDAARQLVQTIQAVLAEADQRGVLEDCP